MKTKKKLRAEMQKKIFVDKNHEGIVFWARMLKKTNLLDQNNIAN